MVLPPGRPKGGQPLLEGQRSHEVMSVGCHGVSRRAAPREADPSWRGSEVTK